MKTVIIVATIVALAGIATASVLPTPQEPVQQLQSTAATQTGPVTEKVQTTVDTLKSDLGLGNCYAAAAATHRPAAEFIHVPGGCI